MSKLNDALWLWRDPAVEKTIEAAEELVRLLKDQLVGLEADRNRLDYLQSGNLSVYEVFRIDRVPTTEVNTRYEEVRVPLGWSISGREDEFENVREAIDFAREDMA